MRALDPALDYAAYSNEQERVAQTSKHLLRFEDLLDRPFEFEGATFDLKVDIWLERDGESGAIEISSSDFSSNIFVQLPGHSDNVKLDYDSYRTLHKSKWERLQKAIEAKALTMAKLSNDWKTEDEL